MASLIAAMTAFVGSHLVLSSRAVRTPLIAKLGPGRFSGVYSLVALAGLVWMVWAYADAPYVPLWTAPGWTRWIVFVAMPLSMLLLVIGFTTPSPTAVEQGKRLDDPDAARGVLRVTRHPALSGFALWGLAHVPTNGDLRSLVLFGGIVLLAVAGMAHIDARRAHEHGDAWRAFASRTSAVPFVAIARGRQRLSLREIGLVRPLVALGIWAGLLLVHEWLVGVAPWPR